MEGRLGVIGRRRRIGPDRSGGRWRRRLGEPGQPTWGIKDATAAILSGGATVVGQWVGNAATNLANRWGLGLGLADPSPMTNVFVPYIAWQEADVVTASSMQNLAGQNVGTGAIDVNNLAGKVGEIIGLAALDNDSNPSGMIRATRHGHTSSVVGADTSIDHSPSL